MVTEKPLFENLYCTKCRCTTSHSRAGLDYSCQKCGKNAVKQYKMPQVEVEALLKRQHITIIGSCASVVK